MGYASVGDSTAAIGSAATRGVVSLGDGGIATLTFSSPITDGAGADFCVFENGFDDIFLELAFVEVSSDGRRYVRFPSVSGTQDTTPIGGFGSVDARAINNLAGKYRANYGTPFDLAELRDSAGLDVQHITHVRVIDVVGYLDSTFARRDSRGHKVNDPWPTPYPSGGFDLDAVGVIHQLPTAVLTTPENAALRFYPIPAQEVLYIESERRPDDIRIYDIEGREYIAKAIPVYANTWAVSTSELASGSYLIRQYGDGELLGTGRFIK
jgi:hypothetical protein